MVAETFAAVIVLRVVFAVVATLLVFGCLYLFGQLKFLTTLAVMLSTLAWCLGTAVFPTWLFQGVERMGFVVLFNLASKASSTALIFLLVRRSDDLPKVIAIYGLSGLFAGVVAFLYGRRLVGAFQWPSLAHLWRELKLGWPMFFTSLSSVVLTNSGVILAGLFLPAAVVGGYAATERLAKAANTMFQPITQAIFPRISGVMAASLSAGIRLALRFAKPALLGVILVAATLMIFRVQIVAAFAGVAYIAYATALLPLGLWFIFGVVNNFAGIQVLTAAGRAHVYSRAFAVSGIIALAFTFLSLAHIGYMAIPVGILLGEVLLSVLLLPRVYTLWLAASNTSHREAR
ncbi:hypothetical protein Dalu01_03276 [Deinococcus aluminii]|uniref:Polysaccharide biosynthesis protein C-terminal domain-containing protein n=1 Tax=Deinococcus aluminii TaxID=1656885 RepID=A0ABP9XIT7_9DEIO